MNQRKYNSVFNLILIIVLTVIGFLNPDLCNAQAYEWGRGAGSSGNFEEAQDVVVDAQGNVYISGTFRNGANFNGYFPPNLGGTDMLLAKYSRNGNLHWVRNFGGVDDDKSLGLDIDNAGNVYMSGYAKLALSQAPPHGGGNSGLRHAQDGVFTKIDPSGNIVWFNAIDGSNYTKGYNIASDPTGGAVGVGIFDGDLYYNSDTLYGIGQVDNFVIAFDNLGNLKFWKAFGGTLTDDWIDVDVDDLGYTYIAGVFQGTAYFGKDTLYGNNNDEAFLCKLDHQGNVMWSHAFTGPNIDAARQVKVTNDGMLYVCGSYRDSLFFPGTALGNNGWDDVFLAKFDTAGNEIWVKHYGGASSERNYAMDINENQDILFNGSFGDSAEIGPFKIYSLGVINGYFASVDSSGVPKYLVNFGGTGVVFTAGIRFDNAGNPHIAGTYLGPFVLGPDTLPNFGSDDLVVAKYGVTPILEITNVTGYPFCLEENFLLSYYLEGCFDSLNTFTAELSDSAGSFASPVIIGTSDGFYSGNISCAIPANADPGSGYRVRVLSSDPALTSADNGFDMVILSSQSYSLQITGDSVITDPDSTCLNAGSGFLSYLWNTGDTTQLICVAVADTYSVTVIDSNGCSNFDQFVLMVLQARDEKLNFEKLDIYPNPANEVLNILIQKGDIEAVEIDLYDYSGKLMLSKKYAKGRRNIHEKLFVADLSTGIYFLRIKSGKAMMSRKIMID